MPARIDPAHASAITSAEYRWFARAAGRRSRGDGDEGPPVRERRQGHGAGTEHHQARRPQLTGEAAEPCSEWSIVGRLPPDEHLRGPGREEPGAVPLGEVRPGCVEAALQGPGVDRRCGGEDEDGDRRHDRSSLTTRRVPAVGRVRAYIGLGANVGDAAATLAAAVRALAVLPGARLAGVSRLYATAPVGVVDQPRFSNAAVALDVPAGRSPEEGAVALLIALKGLERAFGRQPRRHWGPREVDLDLLVFGRHAIEVDRPPSGRSTDPDKAALPLTVPHREARHRLFVLAPLSDLVPGLAPPGWGETVATAAARQRSVEGADAVRAIASWAGDGWRPLG